MFSSDNHPAIADGLRSAMVGSRWGGPASFVFCFTAAARSERISDADAVDQILDQLEQRAPDLGRGFASESKQIASYAESIQQALPKQEVAAYIERKVKLFVATARRGRAPAGAELDFVRERAALRARQLFPLEGLLELHNLGQRAIWDALWATRAPTPAGARAATSLIPFTFDFAIAVNGAVVDGYLRERSFGLVDVARARREALEVLLTKDGASYDDVAGLATSLGIRFGEEHVMIAAAASGAGRELTPERLRQSAELLGRRTNARAEQPFTVVRHDEIVTIVGLEGREPSSVAGAIAQAADEAAHRYGVHLVAGVSSAFRAPDQLGSAYAQSRRALVHASSRGCALALQQVGVFDELVASAGPIALTVIPDGVRAFLGEDSRNGGTLVRTLLAYAEANLSVGGTAQKLSVHPNTVHYRLKRIKKLSGKEPRHLPELVELVTAVRLLGNHAE